MHSVICSAASYYSDRVCRKKDCFFDRKFWTILYYRIAFNGRRTDPFDHWGDIGEEKRDRRDRLWDCRDRVEHCGTHYCDLVYRIYDIADVAGN